MPDLKFNDKGKQHQGCVHMVWRKPDKPWPPRDSRKKLAKLLIESKNDKGAQTVVGVVELRFTHENKEVSLPDGSSQELRRRGENKNL